MTRTELIGQTLANLGHEGSANELAAGPALAKLIQATIDEDVAHAAKTGKPATDPRSICISVMKDVRRFCTRLRDELDGMDGVGKYK